MAPPKHQQAEKSPGCLLISCLLMTFLTLLATLIVLSTYYGTLPADRGYVKGFLPFGLVFVILPLGTISLICWGAYFSRKL
jgi:TRAP-type C4-dicarboxylate transport system permease small subunit